MDKVICIEEEEEEGRQERKKERKDVSKQNKNKEKFFNDTTRRNKLHTTTLKYQGVSKHMQQNEELSHVLLFIRVLAWKSYLYIN